MALINLGLSVLDLTLANNSTVVGAGYDTIIGGDSVIANLTGGYDNIRLHDNALLTIGGGNNVVAVHDKATINIVGGNNNVTMHDNGSATFSNTLTEANGYSGTASFGDAVSIHSGDTLAFNYTLDLGNADTVTVAFNPAITYQGGAGGDSITDNFLVAAGNSDLITFASAGQAITLDAAGSDTITTTGANDTITIGNSATAGASAATQAATNGACSNGIIITVGATAAGTTFNGGIGTDTFTAGAGYDGGNHYIGSLGTQAELFAGEGNCVNYSGLSCYVVVNYNTGIGQAYNAMGQLQWTDTYTDIEQVKGGALDGNVLFGSNAYFNELKGGNGQTTYYDGAGGDRIIWGKAGSTGLDDGQGSDIAYLGHGQDELYWRNQPYNSKGESNFGETAYGFSTAQGDDLNFSELCTAGYGGAGGWGAVPRTFSEASDLLNWVTVQLASNGTDTVVDFDTTGTGTDFQAAVTLKGVNLIAQCGLSSTAPGAAGQVVLDLYNNGNLVM